MRYLCSSEEIRLERRRVTKSWLLGFLLALLYCPRQVKNVWDDILEMLPEKPNKAEIMKEDYCLETLCCCLLWRVRWSTFSFQRSIGLLNSCTSIWNYLFQGFLWLFWKRKNSYSLCMLFIFLQRQSWCFLLTWKCCNTHSSVMLCQTHGLNQHIHLHTVLPTGKYPTVTGFSCYTEPFQWFKPSSLVPFIFLPNFVLMKISFPLKWVLQKRQALC